MTSSTLRLCGELHKFPPSSLSNTFFSVFPDDLPEVVNGDVSTAALLARISFQPLYTRAYRSDVVISTSSTLFTHCDPRGIKQLQV